MDSSLPLSGPFSGPLSGPLSGLVVVEASSFVAAPYCGMTLAEQGATVIRVDSVAGGPDHFRWPLHENGASLYWQGLNKGKRSVTLDFKTERETLRALLEKADAFVTNWLPEKWIDPVPEGLVICRVQGQADGGNAVDYTINAATGLPLLQGDGATPINSVLPSWDFMTGLHAANAVTTALFAKARGLTSETQRLAVSLEDVAVGALASLGMMAEQHFGQRRPHIGNHVFGTFGRDFRFSCGTSAMLVAVTTPQWRALVAAMDLTDTVNAYEKAKGAKLDNDGERFKHRNSIAAWIDNWCRTHSYAQACAKFDGTAVCHGPYKTLANFSAADHAALSDQQHGHGLRYPTATSPVQREGARAAAQTASEIGADSAWLSAFLAGKAA